MKSLDISNNNIGELVPPEGWSIKDKGKSWQNYVHADGREQKEAPEGSSPVGAIALADALVKSKDRNFKNYGALVKLNMSNNKLWALGLKHLAEALVDNQTLAELDISSNSVTESETRADDMTGVIAMSNTIPTMGVLTSLDLSNNPLRVEGAKHIAAAIPKCE